MALEAPSSGPKTQDTRAKLDELKAGLEKKKNIGEQLQYFLENAGKLSGMEKVAFIGNFIVSTLLGKYLGMDGKKDTEKKQDEKEDSKNPDDKKVRSSKEEKDKYPTPKEEKSDKEDETESGVKSDDLSKIPNRLGQGKLNDVLGHFIPGVEVMGELRSLNTTTYKRRGPANWSKNSTDNWDYKKVGNTDEGMSKGEYYIEGITAPDGYTRSGVDIPPSGTKNKLTKICLALLKDPRMPLFTGIPLRVDGVEIMIVKEIHLNPESQRKPGQSDFLYQPHTGTSYIMKT